MKSTALIQYPACSYITMTITCIDVLTRLPKGEVY